MDRNASNILLRLRYGSGDLTMELPFLDRLRVGDSNCSRTSFAFPISVSFVSFAFSANVSVVSLAASFTPDTVSAIGHRPLPG